MSSRTYKGFFVSVRAVLTANDAAARRPLTTISATEGDESMVAIFSTDDFFTDKDAEVYAFQIGKKWVDERLKAESVADHRSSIRHRALTIPFLRLRNC